MKLVHVDPARCSDAGARGRLFCRYCGHSQGCGSTVVGSIDRPAGHHAGVPLAPDKLKTKYEACVRRHLTRDRMDGFYGVKFNRSSMQEAFENSRIILPPLGARPCNRHFPGGLVG